MQLTRLVKITIGFNSVEIIMNLVERLTEYMETNSFSGSQPTQQEVCMLAMLKQGLGMTRIVISD